MTSGKKVRYFITCAGICCFGIFLMHLFWYPSMLSLDTKDIHKASILKYFGKSLVFQNLQESFTPNTSFTKPPSPEKKSLNFRSHLIPEPPRPGMGFIAQKPGKGYSNFSDEIKSKGIQLLKTRTYPSVPRQETCRGCFPYIYQTVLGVKRCKDSPSLKLLIVVTTIPKEKATRKAIRETWGKNTNTTKTVFLIGVGWSANDQKSLMKESEQYGDILQENYIDSYFNLTMKVLSGYHWWSKNCQNVPFVLRTAGDNFINVPGLLRMLNSRPVWPTKMIGHCVTGFRPIRSVGSKWYVSPLEHPRKVYFPYCIGTAFVTPASTVRQIIKASADVPYYVLEDCYFGMVLTYANHGGRGTMPMPGFNAGFKRIKGKGKNKDVCQIQSNWVNIHNVAGPSEMYWIWHNCKT